jgi:hypothetical protein
LRLQPSWRPFLLERLPVFRPPSRLCALASHLDGLRACRRRGCRGLDGRCRAIHPSLHFHPEAICDELAGIGLRRELVLPGDCVSKVKKYETTDLQSGCKHTSASYQSSRADANKARA